MKIIQENKAPASPEWTLKTLPERVFAISRTFKSGEPHVSIIIPRVVEREYQVVDVDHGEVTVVDGHTLIDILNEDSTSVLTATLKSSVNVPVQLLEVEEPKLPTLPLGEIGMMNMETRGYALYVRHDKGDTREGNPYHYHIIPLNGAGPLILHVSIINNHIAQGTYTVLTDVELHVK